MARRPAVISGSTRRRSDGEIFLVIQNDVSADMQPYKDRVRVDDIWHLVNYLRSLGPKCD